MIRKADSGDDPTVEAYRYQVDHIPEPMIRRRFHAGIANFHALYKSLVDAWRLYPHTGPSSGSPGGEALSQVVEIDYRSRCADNLGKELPRIPAEKTFSDSRAFSQAGRDLARWHLNHETVACHRGVAVEEVLSSSATVADRG